MAPSPELSEPGSSIYKSNTLYVGDGTWDSSRNTFLLPNLMGVNFDTMRYNGMGNRFRDLTGYTTLVVAHGTVAAITFLLVVPAAILIAKFYSRNGRLALRLHIWLQITTIGLITIAFVLGWMAVGPSRSLTNPHHGIGLALYVLIWFQVFGGWFIHSTEKGKTRYRLPLKLMLHQWLGRAIALLGIAQVALGLTLYGSPEVYFILFAVWVFLLLLVYFILSYRAQPVGMIGESTSSYFSESVVEERPERREHRSRLGPLAGIGAVGAGLAALRRRSSSRRRPSESEVQSTTRPSTHGYTDSYVDEKYSEGGRQDHTWRNRLLGAGAGLGVMAAFRKWREGRRRDDDSMTASEVTSYHNPNTYATGANSVSRTDLSRIEQGHAPASPANERVRPGVAPAATAAAAQIASPSRSRTRLQSRTSVDSLTTYMTPSDVTPAGDRRKLGFSEGIAALGLMGYAREKWKQRKDRRDDDRVAEMRRRDEMENERINRANSKRYTGDGAPRPRRHGSMTDGDESSIITGSTPELNRHRPPVAAGANVTAPGIRPVPPAAAAPSTSTLQMPLPPPIPSSGAHQESSASETYTSPSTRRNHRNRRPGSASVDPAVATAAAAGAAAGASMGAAAAGKHGSGEGSMGSPPVSVQIKMHTDGRQVTLRRLPEAEAAAERDARRRDKSKKRTGSLSSHSNTGDERWRRVERMEAAQAQQAAPGPSSVPLPPPPPGPPPAMAAFPHTPISSPSQGPGGYTLPPPPPIPASGVPAGSAMGTSVGSPGGGPYDTGTDLSNYDSNRRRRRAERAQARLNNKGATGTRVEFE